MNPPRTPAHPCHMHFGIWSDRRARMRLLTRGWLVAIPILWAIRWWVLYAAELDQPLS